MKIAFVGASGYGNVGDDTYPLVFRQQLPEHELVFYNSDLPSSLPADLAMIVFGGGGILHNVGGDSCTAESPHFRCMKHYADAADIMDIPFGFLSCGFQFANGRDASNVDDLRPWAECLRAARFVTTRSPACRELAAGLGARSDVHFFPDAAYLFKPDVHANAVREKIVTLIPAGLVNPRNVFTNHMIRLLQSARCKLRWLSMGAEVDDAAHLSESAVRFPDAEIIRRSSPAEACAKIAESAFVMTGRYHGMIFARTAGVPFYVPQASPHKIMSEDLSADLAEASGHFDVLRRALAGL